MMTLTVAEIKDLAECVGLVLDKRISYDADEMETEIVVIECSKEGVHDDSNKPAHYTHVAYFAEYPEEGCYPLGPELKPNNNNLCPMCSKPWDLHEFAVPAPYCP